MHVNLTKYITFIVSDTNLVDNRTSPSYYVSLIRIHEAQMSMSTSPNTPPFSSVVQIYDISGLAGHFQDITYLDICIHEAEIPMSTSPNTSHLSFNSGTNLVDNRTFLSYYLYRYIISVYMKLRCPCQPHLLHCIYRQWYKFSR